MSKTSHILSEQQQLALQYLTLANKAHHKTGKDRVYWAHLARKYGLPYRLIGEALGMTEAGARMLITRNQPEVNRG